MEWGRVEWGGVEWGRVEWGRVEWGGSEATLIPASKSQTKIQNLIPAILIRLSK